MPQQAGKVCDLGAGVASPVAIGSLTIVMP